MSVQVIDGIGSVRFTRFPTDQAVVDRYNDLLQIMKAILYKDPNDVTDEDGRKLLEAMDDLKELARGGINRNGTTSYVSSDMARQIDLINRSLLSVGIENRATKTDVLRWKDMGIDGVDALFVRAEFATETGRSLQALVELEYIRTANEILTEQLSTLETALSSTKRSIEILTELQNIRNLAKPVDISSRANPIDLISKTPNERSRIYAESVFKFLPEQFKNYYAPVLTISSADDLLIGTTQRPLPVTLANGVTFTKHVGTANGLFQDIYITIPANTFGVNIPPGALGDDDLEDVMDQLAQAYVNEGQVIPSSALAQLVGWTDWAENGNTLFNDSNFPQQNKKAILADLGYTETQQNDPNLLSQNGFFNTVFKGIWLGTPDVFPGSDVQNQPPGPAELLDKAFKDQVEIEVDYQGRSPQDVLKTVIQLRLDLAVELTKLDKLNPPGPNGRDPNSLAGKIAIVLNDLETAMGPLPLDFSNPNALATVITGLENWIIDNQNAASGTAGADTAGDFQRNLTAALTAATNLNDRQKEEFRRYMFVFEEYYKSASAILSKLNQIIERMAQNAGR